MIWPGWEHQLLSAMGRASTKPRVEFLRAWADCEGGSARFNPLNTTLRVPGSSSYNSAGVQHYEDRLQGLAATLLTIRLSHYAGVRDALGRRGIGSRRILQLSESGIRTWGTNPACIERAL